MSSRFPMVVAAGALLVASVAAQASDKPGKHALLVAISDYPDGTGYPDLNAHNDLPLVTGALRRQGFAKDRITVLRDEEATREGLVAALEELISVVETGDSVVFHYSGHGHRITDDDGDELDGYDEVLVPWGAPARFEKGYAGDLHLRDDDLGSLLDELRWELGPSGSLLVSLDSCYSGSATRGVEELPTRGMDEPLGPPASSRGTRTGGSGFHEPAGVDPSRLAPFAVISAASHDEKAHETRDRRHSDRIVGGLSLALGRALATARRGMTWGALFERIKVEMATTVPKQTPQLEGMPSALVFRGEVLEQAPHLSVVDVGEDGQVVVDGGTLVGLLPDAEVEFHPPGTVDPRDSRALTSGTVVAADEATSRVEPSTRVSDKKLRDSWVFVTRHSFGDLAVRVAMTDAVPRKVQDQVRAALDGRRTVELVDEGPHLLVDQVGRRTVQVFAAAEHVELGDPIDLGEGADALIEQVDRFARSQYLRELHISDRGVSVRLEVVPAEINWTPSGEFAGCTVSPVEDHLSDGHQLVFHPGDGYLLRFHNEGRTRAWLTVLDLMSDGTVDQLFPPAGEARSDTVIPAGETILVQDPCFQVGEPYGTEVLKLFATRTQVDFRPLLDPERVPTRGEELGPLEALLADTMASTVTRSAPMRLPTGLGTDYSVTIQVERAP